MKGELIILLMIILAGMSCKTAYTPPAITSPASYLVVEGTIITGSIDSTIFKLSHTVNISGKDTSAAETGAQVAVQDEAGRSYTLTDNGSGKYVAAPLNLPLSGKYRLQVKRRNGNSYQSDYVQAKTSSPIDSVTYRDADEGLYTYLYTHDATNTTRYYRWEYQEDWQFHTYYESLFIADGSRVRRRTAAENVYYCFQTQQSNVITLGNSTKLAQDIITQQPITFVRGASEKVNYIYSIEVRQYPLTQEAYIFWQNLKKNTEQLGSIFDAQPSQLTGNIHNVANAAEPVIGYISAGTVAKKRIYVERFKINRAWLDEENKGCDLENLYKPYVYNSNGENQVAEYILSHLALPLTEYYKNVDLTGRGFSGSPFYCGDCTMRGVTQKPSFWPF